MSRHRLLEDPPRRQDDDGREGTIASSTFALTVSACGAGVLSLPYALRCGGWFGATLSLGAVAMESFWSLALIELRARDLGQTSYEDIGAALYGPRIGYLVEGCMFMLLLLAEVTFLVLIADLVPPACEAAPKQLREALCGRRQVIIAAVVLALPPSLHTRLHALRHSSVAALICLLVLLAVVAAEALAERLAGEGMSLPPMTVARDPLRLAWLSVVPIQAAAFCNHFNFCQVVNELRDPTPARTRAVRLLSAGSCFVISAAYGSTGYLAFGDTVDGDLLNSLDARVEEGRLAGGELVASGIVVGRVALAVCLLLKVPLLMQPLRAIVLRWAGRLGLGAQDDVDEAAAASLADADDDGPGWPPGPVDGIGSPKVVAGFESPAQHRRAKGAHKSAGDGPGPVKAGPPRGRRLAGHVGHLAATTLPLSLAALVALAVSHVEQVFALAGALGLSLVVFVLPGSFAFRPPFSIARRASVAQRAQGALLVATGVVLTAGSAALCAFNAAGWRTAPAAAGARGGSP